MDPHVESGTGWKSVLKIAWPLIVANSFWNLQLTIDRIFLGNYSVDALGAAMAVMGAFWVPMALLQQTSAYAMTFVAQYLGAGRLKMIGSTVWQSIYVSVFGGLLFFGLMPLLPALFHAMGHSPHYQELELQYFTALCYSALPTALVAAASAFYTGLGQSQRVIGINAVGLVANVFFDYLLVFGKWGFPAMGIRGAGYATALANWAAAFYSFTLIFNAENEQQFGIRSRWRWDGDLMKRFIRFGLPSGMQWALEGLAFSVFLIFIGRLSNGEQALAGSGIAVTVMMLAVLPAMGVAQAVSVLVGQHLGENNPVKAELSTWSGLRIAALYIFCMALTFVAFPGFYSAWFANPQDPEKWAQVREIVHYLLLFIAAFTTFDSMNLVFSLALKGAGDTRFVTVVALVLPWPLMVLPTWWVSRWENGVYWAWGAASVFVVTQAMVFWRRFVGGRWKTMRVIE